MQKTGSTRTLIQEVTNDLGRTIKEMPAGQLRTAEGPTTRERDGERGCRAAEWKPLLWHMQKSP